MVIAVFWLWGCFDHQVDMIRKQLGHSSRKGLKGATRGSISSTLYTGRDVTKVSGSINPFLRCLLYWYSGEIACDLFAFDYLMHTENSGEETNSSFDTDGQTLTDSFQSVQRVVFQTGGEWLFQPISKIPYIYIPCIVSWHLSPYCGWKVETPWNYQATEQYAMDWAGVAPMGSRWAMDFPPPSPWSLAQPSPPSSWVASSWERPRKIWSHTLQTCLSHER